MMKRLETLPRAPASTILKTHYQTHKGFLEPINSIISKLPVSEIVDLQPVFFRFTLATTTALIFRQSTDGLETEKQKTYASNFNHASFVSALRMHLVDFTRHTGREAITEPVESSNNMRMISCNGP